MPIFQTHLPYVDFVKNEIHTLEVLQALSYLPGRFDQLYSQAYEVYNRYLGVMKNNRLEATSFEFKCHFDLSIEKGMRKFFVECIVAPGFEEVSYMLAICQDDSDNPQIIRKFHFDYALPQKNQDPKPVYHFQYGGDGRPTYNENELDIEHMQPWLSNPRINYTPMSLAILLDSIFYELKYQNESTYGLVERQEWCDLIKHNEDVILKPYFQRINTFFNSTDHRFDFLLRDFYYGR